MAAGSPASSKGEQARRYTEYLTLFISPPLAKVGHKIAGIRQPAHPPPDPLEFPSTARWQICCERPNARHAAAHGPHCGPYELLTVLRYLDRNPLRAKLVRRAENWRYGSLWLSGQAEAPAWLLPASRWPLKRPADWLEWVNTPQTPNEEAEVQACIKRGRPYGSPRWTKQTARDMDLESTLTPRGRPVKHANKKETRPL